MNVVKTQRVSFTIASGQPSGTGTFTGDFITQVIQDTGAATQRGTFTTGATSDNATITDVGTTLTIPIAASGHPYHTYQNAWEAGYCDEYLCRMWLSSGTQIDIASSAAPSARNLSWQTVQFSEAGGAPTPRRVMVIS